MKKQQKNTHFKTILALFIVAVVLSTGTISAADWDNSKSYDPETKTITVTNLFGLGDVVAKIQLGSPLDFKVPIGEEILVAWYDLENMGDYDGTSVFDIVETLDLKRGNSDIQKNIVFKEKKISMEDFPNLITTCGGTGSFHINGTEITECTTIQDGEIEKEITEWKVVKENNLLESGNYTIGLFTEVEYKEKVEWIPTMYGVEITEWAVWTAALNVGLINYYKLDSSSGTNAIDSVGNVNLTFQDSWVAGKINNGDGVHELSSLDSGHNPNGDTGFSISFWIKDDGTAISGYIGGYNNAGDINNAGLFIQAEALPSFVQYPGGTIKPTTAIDGNFHMITYTSKSGEQIVYFDGVNEDNSSEVINSYVNVNFAWFSYKTAASGSPYWLKNAVMDEIGLWNRSLSQAEVTQIYNGGDGISFTDLFTFDPEVTLTTPTNDTYDPLEITNFAYTILYNGDDWVNQTFNVWNSANTLIKNRFWVNGTIDDDCFISDNNATQVEIECTGQDITTDGSYYWNVYGCNSDNLCDWAENNFTFTIDTLNPNVTITAPTENQSFLTNTLPYTIYTNVTITDTNLDSCIFFNSTGNNTIVCGVNSSTAVGSGTHSIRWYANDSVGNSNTTERSFLINYYFDNQSYTNPAVEGETYDFNLSVTAGDLGEFNGTFYYNGSAQSTLYADNGTRGLLGSSLTTNLLGNVSFNWIYYVNGTMVNSSSSHIVNQISNLTVTGGNCPAGLSAALHYDLKNEQNDTTLNSTIDFIFKYGVSNSTLRTTSGTIENTEFSVCINSTVYNDYSFGYGEIQYQPTGYSDRRYYTFSSDRLSNNTINNTLYSLVSASSTSFLFTIQQGDLSVFNDIYLTLNRWYPEEDNYKIVEMSRTDDEGQTVMKVEVEDVDYRVGVYYQNGTLIYLAAPFRLVCIATPCSYSLIVPEDAGNSLDNWNNLQVSLDFNYTTSIFTMVYNDPSQDTDAINLSVYRDTGISELLICSDSSSSYTAVLSCNVSGYSGLLRGIGFRTASPETSIISKIVQQGIDKLDKTPSLFITVLIMIFLVSVGVVSPILTVILSVLAFIPALIFGVMPLSILLIIAAMGFIVIHFMKRSVSG